MENKTYDVIILGGGPAGLTAAIYTSRAHLNTLVLAGNPPGGQLTTTTDVENFPGFPNGIMGPKLVENVRDQAKKFGTKFENKNATSVSGTFEDGFNVVLEDGLELKGKTLIVASGASAKYLGLESEQRLIGKGVSACATCDGFFFNGKDVAVVGGGDSAMEEALFLTRFANKVYILIRKDMGGIRASKIMQERVFAHKKIECLCNTEVKEVLGQFKVEGIKIINNDTKVESDLDVQGLFLAIGHKPNTEYLEGFIELGKKNYAVVTNNVLSSVKGVFLAGDIADYRYRQAITAAGFGTMAALEAEKLLSEHGVDTKSSTSW
ncbi:thioredoxin-disulfide reductase [Patescibacteria group bacterium]